MIRTAEGGLTTKFFNAAFLDFMSHFCDVDAIPPCIKEGEIYNIDEELLQSVPESFVRKISRGELHAFTKVGRLPFIRKKVVQLIAIAKSDEEIQLNLVSEFVLWLIGATSYMLVWKDEKGRLHDPDEYFDYPEIDALKKEFIKGYVWSTEDSSDYEEELNEAEANFDEWYYSFVSIMQADSEEQVGIFWDIHFSFFSDTDVVEGIRILYTVCSDYDRDWHVRPWVEIGEPIPEPVISVLDQIEMYATRFGGLANMRNDIAMRHQKQIAEIIFGRPEVLE